MSYPPTWTRVLYAGAAVFCYRNSEPMSTYVDAGPDEVKKKGDKCVNDTSVILRATEFEFLKTSL